MINKRYFAVFILFIVVLSTGGVVYMKTRGLRNNNPGNIELNHIKWNGMAMAQTDGRFIQFKTPEYGIRALAKILKNYHAKHGINTIRGVINRYAPSVENNTESYISSVARYVGVGADDTIDFSNAATMRSMLEAIIRHENGLQPYSVAVISKGLDMAA